ncbi:MAG: MBL fold metallo-hydrolase [Terrimicrobiaceae bacterium]|nr:MBL fold metallo-hydrolase [Terrimicrobiaceae bacterium]
MRRLIFLGAAVCLALLGGCGGREQVSSTLAERQVRVEWLGNQCFRITSSIGTTILTNPFASGTGGRTFPSNLRPDIVLISQENSEANNIDALANSPTVFRGSVGMGVNNSSGIRIRGVATFQDPNRELVTGMNIVYVWSMDGVRFCFLGSLANPLTPLQASEIGAVDVLFVPVGGSLSPSARESVISQLRPRVVIPMGRAPGWTTGMVRRADGSSVMLSRSALPLQLTTILLAP